MRRVVLISALVVLATACRPGAGASDSSLEVEASAAPREAGIPLCEDVPQLSAPAESYRDSPIYAGNDQPTDVVGAWAEGKPGFETMWVDRDHLGWISLAFSEDAEARQAELEEEFPEIGVVAIPVDWTMPQLHALQARVGEELGRMFEVSSGIYTMQGVVGIGIGVLDEERLTAVEELFAGEPICVEGADPASVPADGPQPFGGDGWRLLADEREVGVPYRTGIAADRDAYERLWSDVGLGGEPPGVDFESEVVIWFGAVYGSSCPELRLDDVVVHHDRAIVHAEIVLLGGERACTLDANPHAYLVALERVSLPAGPFAIQLSADGPPAGAPEERTLVDADLSQPGAVPEPGEVHGDPTLPEPFFLESGAIVEAGFEAPYRMSVHCGVEWLGELNGLGWRTEVPPGTVDFVPPEWRDAVDPSGTLELSILLHEGPEPVIEATANGHTVTYAATGEDPPGCD
jgi:hypothetical protein